MKKILFYCLLLTTLHCAAFSGGDCKHQVLAIIKLGPDKVTTDKVMALMGEPTRMDSSRKGNKWVYAYDSSELVIHWKTNESNADRIYFNCHCVKKGPYDKTLEKKIKEGKMNLGQAVALLGIPKDLVIKDATQVINYNYLNNRLRLFFRDRVLVDCAVVQYVKR